MMRRLPAVRSLAPALAWAALLPATATAGSVPVAGPIATWDVPVESMKSLRFRSVISQQYDFSCGSAALATLLTYHYDRTVPEAVVFDGMFKLGDQQSIRAQGFSMLDMKRYLETEHGLASDGFHISLGELKGLGVPAIAMIETRGYRHFVVVKGVDDNYVLVGDPARGLRSYTQHEFERVAVNDILFVIRDDLEAAKSSFNAEPSWAAVTVSPVETAVDRRGLADFVLNLPPTLE